MSAVAPTWQEFQAAYPSLASVEGGEVQLETSAALLSKTEWDTFYSQGVMLDCAHNLTLAAIAASGVNGGLQAAAGPISSVSVAGTSTSFNSPSTEGKGTSRDWYMKTSYGQQFLRLRNAVVGVGYLAS